MPVHLRFLLDLLVPTPSPNPTSNKDSRPLHSRSSPQARYSSFIFSLLHLRFISRTVLWIIAQETSGAVTRTISRWQPYNPISLISSTPMSPAPYLNTPVHILSTPPPCPTYPGTCRTYPLDDVAQHNPCQAASLAGELNAHTVDTCGPDRIALFFADYPVRSLSEIWQDNYLPTYATTEVAPRPLETRCKYRVTASLLHTITPTQGGRLPQYQRTKTHVPTDTKHTLLKKILSSHQCAAPVKSNIVHVFAHPCTR